jgi:uncharacterized membrane protein (UPF0127 family)
VRDPDVVTPRARLVTATGRDIAEVELADTPWTRARGLLGRSGLPPGVALWLSPCRSIHTLGMRFAIDVVFVDAAFEVVALFAALPPRRLVWGGWRARGAFEFAAGEAARLGVSPGDRLALRWPTETSGAARR